MKQLTPGSRFAAPQLAQEAAARSLGSWAYTPEAAQGVVGRGHTVRDYA